MDGSKNWLGQAANRYRFNVASQIALRRTTIPLEAAVGRGFPGLVGDGTFLAHFPLSEAKYTAWRV